MLAMLPNKPEAEPAAPLKDDVMPGRALISELIPELLSGAALTTEPERIMSNIELLSLVLTAINRPLAPVVLVVFA